MTEKKTPLYERHVAAGGRMVPFAGYLLPVQYEGIAREHEAVRTAAGLFDVSHMGEVAVTGPRAFAFLQGLVTNDLAGMADGAVRYSPLCYENGGTVDDLLIYRRSPHRYLVVVNAANREKDVAFMAGHNGVGAALEDISDGVAQLALQGPAAAAVLSKLAGEQALPVKYYTFTEHVTLAGVDCLVSRTGYTGEDGFELYCTPDGAQALWDGLLEAGRDHGVIPCGLGARDTLRLEAAMPLYGHELSEDISPLEAGLARFVRPDKGPFPGREALAAQQAAGPARRRCGLALDDRGIAREGAPVCAGQRQVGTVTSGTMSPTLGRAVAMALVEAPFAAPGQSLFVEVRGRRLAARTVSLPFYKRPRAAAQ